MREDSNSVGSVAHLQQQGPVTDERPNVSDLHGRGSGEARHDLAGTISSTWFSWALACIDTPEAIDVIRRSPGASLKVCTGSGEE